MAFFDCEHAVVLDTEVFDSIRYDFESPNLRYLTSLAHDGRVKILVTTIILSEMKAHIAEQARAIVKHLKSAAEQPLFRKFNLDLSTRLRDESLVEAITKAGEKSLLRYLSLAKVEVIEADKVSAEKIIADYFGMRPPFGTGKKKSEFPDAFTLHAIRDWIKDKKFPVTVVSGDSDLQDFCQANSQISHVKSLTAFLALFPDAVVSSKVRDWLDGQWDNIQSSVEEQFKKWDFGGDRGEVLEDTVKLNEMIANFPDVVEIEKDVAHVAVDLELRATADIEIEPHDPRYEPSWVTDAEGRFEIGVDILVGLDDKLEPVELLEIDIVKKPGWPVFRTDFYDY